MEHPQDDDLNEDSYPIPSGPIEGVATEPQQSAGGERGKSKATPKRTERPRTMYDLKVGPPGTRSSETAMDQIRYAYREAIGYKPPDLTDEGLFDTIPRRLQNLFGWANDLPNGPQFTPAKPKPTRRVGAASPDELPHPGDEQLRAVPQATHADMPFAVVPRRWYKHVRTVRGRGATRSSRAYFEAIHILAYVVFMYRGQGRFAGAILHMNQKSICTMLGITSDDYLRAVRYLQREGYITRIVIRGHVPWDPRAAGVYTFAIPRMPKLNQVTVSTTGGR